MDADKAPPVSVPRSPEDVRKDFSKRGLTIASWARSHGFKAKAVQQVLARPAAGRWGDAHRIAVMLGLKEGVIDANADAA